MKEEEHKSQSNDVAMDKADQEDAPEGLGFITDFDWTDYLEAMLQESVPEGAFLHIEDSLDSGVKEGMAVEIPLDDTATKFWLATVDRVFGPLLKLSYVGEPDKKDMWHDLTKEKLYPLGEFFGHIMIHDQALNCNPCP